MTSPHMHIPVIRSRARNEGWPRHLHCRSFADQQPRWTSRPCCVLLLPSPLPQAPCSCRCCGCCGWTRTPPSPSPSTPRSSSTASWTACACPRRSSSRHVRGRGSSERSRCTPERERQAVLPGSKLLILCPYAGNSWACAPPCAWSQQRNTVQSQSQVEFAVSPCCTPPPATRFRSAWATPPCGWCSP